MRIYVMCVLHLSCRPGSAYASLLGQEDQPNFPGRIALGLRASLHISRTGQQKWFETGDSCEKQIVWLFFHWDEMLRWERGPVATGFCYYSNVTKGVAESSHRKLSNQSPAVVSEDLSCEGPRKQSLAAVHSETQGPSPRLSPPPHWQHVGSFQRDPVSANHARYEFSPPFYGFAY